jgi:transcriptional regulator with XRE-family HTH domain
MYEYNINLTSIPNSIIFIGTGGYTMAETLGDRIRKARQAYGMSQAELARRIGISTNSMNLIEVGKTPDPAASRVKAIADVLWVTTDYLLGREVRPRQELTTIDA